MNLTPIELQDDGLKYVQESLEDWGSLAGKHLPFSLSEGRAFALLPEGTSIARAKEFTTGGLLLGLRDSRWIAQRYFAFRRATRNSVIFVEDAVARPTDPSI